MDRLRDPSFLGQSHRERTHRAPAPARQLSPRVQPRLGPEDLLHAAAPGSAPPGNLGRAARRPARQRSFAAAPQATPCGTTGGNPLFLEEIVRTLVEHRALVGERGAYRLVQPSDTLQVPSTVQAILAARIDRLPSEEKRLLETAAVIGKDFAFTLLAAIVDEPESTLRSHLDHLRAAEFLYETSLFPDLEYTFKHALTHEVAYGGLLHERRRVMHGRVLDALERHRSTRLGGQVEQLAHHAVRAEAWEKAIPYLRQSGARAMEHSAYGEAARLFEMLVQAVEHLGDAVDASVKLDAYLELFTARLENAEEEETLQGVIARIEELARLGGNDSVLPRLRLQQAQAAWNLSDSPDGSELAIRLAQQAFDLARPSDLRTRSYAQFLTGSAHRNRGRFRVALQEFERGLSLFTTADREPDTVSTTWPIYVSLSSWGAAEAHAMLGEFDQAIEWGVRGCRVADEIGNAGSRVLAATFQGHVYVLKGEPDSALRSMEPRIPLAEELGQGHLLIKFFLVLSHTYLLLGRADEGLRHLRRALASTKGFMAESRRFGTLSANALLEAGRLDDASAEVAAGLAYSEKTGADGHRAPLLRLRAEMLARRDPPEPEPAQQCWRESLQLAIALGMRPEVAHCHVGLGKLYRRAGDHAKASEHLSTATTMYREMDMGFWLEKADAELGGGER